MEGNSKNLVNQNEYLLGVFLQHQKLDARECAQGWGGGEIVDLQMYLNWSMYINKHNLRKYLGLVPPIGKNAKPGKRTSPAMSSLQMMCLEKIYYRRFEKI